MLYNFVAGYSEIDGSWCLGFTIHSKNGIQKEKTSMLIAALVTKKLMLFDDLV